MRLLKTRLSDRPHLVLHIGLGLIGQSIQRFLARSDFEIQKNYPLNWAEPTNITKALKTASQDIALMAGMGTAQIDIIWSAGKAGFSAVREDFEIESEIFSSLLKLTADLSKPYDVRLHHFSSSGGLFEGQRFVGADTEPVPRRVYGDIKLEQEKQVKDLPKTVSKRIYRPSSVYGYNGRGNRAGLVMALVEKGLSGKPVEIYGRSDTLRDYVYVEDIGRFVVSKIKAGRHEDQIYFLTSGKPTSMAEMLKTVQSLLGKRLHFQYVHAGENASHMSFDRSVFPKGWRPTSAAIGLKKTIMNIQKEYI